MPRFPFPVLARTARVDFADLAFVFGFPARRFNDALEEMSRGMQQKIAIARALLLDPPVLLLDERATGLDPKSERDVQVFLERPREAHGTMAVNRRECPRTRSGFLLDWVFHEPRH